MRIDVPLSKQELSREVSMKGKPDETIISLSATAALIIDRKKRRSIRIAHRIVLQFPAIVDNRTIASSLSAAISSEDGRCAKIRREILILIVRHSPTINFFFNIHTPLLEKRSRDFLCDNGVLLAY